MKFFNGKSHSLDFYTRKGSQNSSPTSPERKNIQIITSDTGKRRRGTFIQRTILLSLRSLSALDLINSRGMLAACEQPKSSGLSSLRRRTNCPAYPKGHYHNEREFSVLFHFYFQAKLQNFGISQKRFLRVILSTSLPNHIYLRYLYRYLSNRFKLKMFPHQ